MTESNLNLFHQHACHLRLCKPALYGVSCALTVLLFQCTATAAIADELFGLGGMVQSQNVEKNDSSYSWQLEYREQLNEHFTASLSYLNEGHIPAHHRDGHSLQLWMNTDVVERRLALSVGVGPYYYFDTTVPSTSSTAYTNEHGFGAAFSLASILRTETPWLFQLRANWIQTFGRMNTVSALVGVGYQLDKPSQPKPSYDRQERWDQTCNNEITLLVGRTITNSFDSERSTALSIEYRRRLLNYLDWTLSWLHEGDNRLIRRDGVASQLWVVKNFMDERISLGLGAGAYLAIDQQANHYQDSDRVISAISTLTGSYHLTSRWSLRASWNRIVTNYDRDTDVIMGGVGYRF
ncbi:hypothetical protein [Trichlorobacter lovleyi]|uniref:Uncharacterized protein n=1 Tax=Trichlorobacter lovleyi (strain ATCC BAA-1151 / DSM 17278 / SZ) TaxID=398767 RepID=B3E225_TRIL1|nr:hypothetical protein [Trichlorobacter lovleyi]ACD97128.1 conserved hypothetical protein [Trichlorobacter lovleyi SZ]